MVFRPGRDDESYTGIGRGAIRLARIPVFVDAEGPFGSTTSDSERSMVTLQTVRLLLLVISYCGPDLLAAAPGSGRRLVPSLHGRRNDRDRPVLVSPAFEGGVWAYPARV